MDSETPMVTDAKPGSAKLTHQTLDKKAAVHGFGWQLAFNSVNKLVLPLASIVFARILGPAEMGAFAIVYTIFMASEVLRDAGLTQSYIREKEMDDRKEAAYMALGTLQGVIPGLLVCAFAVPMADLFNAPKLVWSLPWVGAALAINGVGTIPRAKVLRMGRLYESGLRETIANLIAVAVAVMLVVLGFGYTALLVQLCLNCLLNVAITWGIAPVKRISFAGAGLSETFRSSFTTMGANILFTVYTLADNFVIAPLLPKEALGFYSTGKNLASKPMQLLSAPMMRTMQVAFGQNSADRARLGALYCRAMAGAALFVAPIYLVLALAAEPIVFVLLGKEWLGAVGVVQILCLYMGARTIGATGGTALVAAGQAKVTMISWLAGYVTAAAVLLAPQGPFTVERVAWAFALGAVAVYSFHTGLAFRYFKPDAEARGKVWRALLPLIVTTAFLVGVGLLPISLYIKAAIALLLAPVVHLVSIGLQYERRPNAFMSKSGLKKLYKSL